LNNFVFIVYALLLGHFLKLNDTVWLFSYYLCATKDHFPDIFIHVHFTGMNHFKIFCFFILFVLLNAGVSYSQNKSNQAVLNSQSNFFIENKGQWDQQVKFLAKLNGLNLWVTENGIVYANQELKIKPIKAPAIFPNI